VAPHRSRSARFILASLAVLACGAAGVFAQEDIDLRLFRPQVDLSGETFQDKPFDDMISDEYGSDAMSFSANIPLGKTHVRWDRKYRASQFFAHVQATRAAPDITFLTGPERRLYSGLLAASGVWLSRSNNLYVASAGGSFAEDDRTIHDAQARFYALFLGTHRIREWITLVYGGAATYQFGRGLALPVVGVVWWINPKWTLVGTLPFSAAALYRIRDDLGLRLLVGFAGNRYRFANERDFPNQPLGQPQAETVYLSTLQSRLTAEIEWKAGGAVSLYAQAGTVRNLQFVFSEDAGIDSDKFIDDSTQPAGYLKLGARFTFGKSILDEWKK
jgi:hypothetical protein